MQNNEEENIAAEAESLIEFPCVFPIKIIGKDINELNALLEELIARHHLAEEVIDIQRRDSRNSRFFGLTLQARFYSKQQLDAIYRDLSADARVIMAL